MKILKIIMFCFLVLLCLIFAYLYICLQSHEDDDVHIMPALFLTIFMIPLYMIGKNLFPLVSLFIVIGLIFFIHYIGFIFIMNELSSFTDFGYPLSFSTRNILSCIIPILALVFIQKTTGTTIVYYLSLIFCLIQALIFIIEFQEIIKEIKDKKIRQTLFYIVPVIYHLFLIFLFSM